MKQLIDTVPFIIKFAMGLSPRAREIVGFAGSGPIFES